MHVMLSRGFRDLNSAKYYYLKKVEHMDRNNKDFFFRKAKLPDGEAITFEEAEEFLLKKLEERNGNFKQTLWQLARLYSKMKRHDDSLNSIYKLMQLSDDKEENASFFLALGQLMEKTGDYLSAVEYYQGAFCLKPSNTEVWYLVNNNLGFSLNQLKRYKEAKSYLEAAIKIDPTRPNAHKNLGLCFLGQGNYVKAAENFVASVKADASDPRSLQHLEKLLSDRPELFGDIPDLPEILTKCRNAVKTARGYQPDFEKHWKKLRSQKRGILEN
jgi:tetratricopeptide (TPR) repeat protein